jgi:hypothetical protein
MFSDKLTNLNSFLPLQVCNRRLNLYKELNQISNAQAGQVRAGVLDELGFCEFANENYDQSHRWFETALTETGKGIMTKPIVGINCN